ncbi:ABC transporter permease [Chelativorans sp. AA-79]|uniref:ABC transporter permease n=1 Tax=Chelativorans sp. AA-79 TaxID=3028735 RepID=UPI0023F68B18|nr:ABC transporter permease [Chelativorans sp. AA-79]WEX12059.1 ABC transporter permease [Chelativorans sp. AA-79]
MTHSADSIDGDLVADGGPDTLEPLAQAAARRRDDITIIAAQIGLLLVLLAAWQAIAEFGVVPEIFISKPTSILVSLWNNVVFGRMLLDLVVTVYETLVGFFISSAVGMVVGVILYQAPRVNLVVRPFLTGLNNLPRLALAPLFVLWFGLDTSSRVALVFSVVFFIIVFNTYAGLQNAIRDHLLLARTLGASRFQLFVKFILPSAVPTIFAGLQLGLTYSFLTAVVGEMLSGAVGLGAQLQITLATYRTADFFAALLLLAIVATVLSGLMRLAERRLLRWRQFEQGGVASPT